MARAARLFAAMLRQEDIERLRKLTPGDRARMGLEATRPADGTLIQVDLLVAETPFLRSVLADGNRSFPQIDLHPPCDFERSSRRGFARRAVA